MAKYIGSPWGIITGKLGPAIGFRHRGRNVIRVMRCPRSRASLSLLKQVDNGKAKLSEVSVGQVNIIIVANAVSNIIKNGMKELIRPVWDPLARIRNLQLSGSNLFFKYNTRLLYWSIPDRKTFVSKTNLPDLRLLRLSEGNLEGVTIEKAFYSRGKIEVWWSSFYYKDASPEDDVYLFVSYWGVPVVKSLVKLSGIWSYLKLWGSARTPVGKRKAGHTIFELTSDSLLTPSEVGMVKGGQLTVYLSCGKSGCLFSPSSSYRINMDRRR